MSNQYPYLVVRTHFHRGGIVSKHKTREAAEKAANRYRGTGCACGCAGVVTAEEYEQLRELRRTLLLRPGKNSKEVINLE